MTCPTLADLLAALGVGGRVPVAPAARTPLVAVLLGMPSSLHVEDG